MLAPLFRALAAFTPTLVGTYPLGLQVDGSDFDLACSCDDLDQFERAVRAILGALGVEARIARTAHPAVVAAIEHDGVAIEIFGQAIPVHAQHGFRHMIVEGQLLAHGGAALRTRVLELKRAGLKTEPAFARALGLTGDPYAGLLALEAWPPDRLAGLVARAQRSPLPIAPFTGDRAALLPLFRLADDSEAAIASYRDRGAVLVALDGATPVGHVQMIELAEPATWELMSLAVAATHQRLGLGARLVRAGLAHARAHGASRILLATGAADTNLLRFYQRLGFRLLRIERDAFTPAHGYPPDLAVDGIPLLDRAWLDLTW